jgi:hypothetical protein
MRRFLILLACACGLVVAAVAARPAKAPAVRLPDGDVYLKRIVVLKKETWRWQRLMGKPLTHALPRPVPPLPVRPTRWTRIAIVARLRAHHPPHLRAFLCIHRYEGSWTDSGGPYYGGLQMDWGFMSAYGRQLLRRKGTADHWTPLEQIWVAERAYRNGRGFYAWPNTARYCGLI